MKGIVGRKLGMTRVFDAETGAVTPVTVIEAGPCPVVQVKTAATDGYEAVQLGLVEGRAAKENKPTAGHFKKAGVPATRVRREVKVAAGGDAPKPGDQVNVAIFADGERVDVIGTSKGKGTAGVMKRHHFGGQPASHGTERKHRSPGSIASHATWRGQSGKPKKGLRMAGRMGAVKTTTLSLTVHKVDTERGLLLIKGAIPGPKGGLVLVRSAVKGGPVGSDTK